MLVQKFNIELLAAFARAANQIRLKLGAPDNTSHQIQSKNISLDMGGDRV